MSDNIVYVVDEAPSPREAIVGLAHRVIGTSPALAEVLRQIESVATTDTTILLQGETGTGKESLARAIHERSGRSGRFIKVNCAAIPAGLLESELMGHEKGSFTGAVTQRIGRFELAQDGTIFLDEIGELPLELQPKLLRVLQEREFERIGGSRTVQSSARVVTATNRNLTAMVGDRTFREDLYYRLAVFPISVPPLRERTEDIPLLANHFVAGHAQRLGKRVDPPSAEVLATLSRYAWPGNIRELQNVLERAVIMASGGVLEVPQLATEPPPAPPRPEPSTLGFDVIAFIREQLSPPGRNVYDETHRQVDRLLLTLALEHTQGNQREAARLVGISRQTMRTRMRSLGLHVSRAVESD